MRRIVTFVFICMAFATAAAQQKSEPNIEQCSRRLVSYADWPTVKDPQFVIDLSFSGGRLYYFGAEHSADPSHHQFQQIQNAWDAIKPTVAFYEGPNRAIAGAADETIKQAGESGFVRFLATRDGIPFKSLEPSPQEEAAYIVRKYSPEQVMLFYVLRETARLRDRRNFSEEQLKNAVTQLLGQASKMKGFEQVMPNLEALDAAYRRHWKSPAQWWQAPAQWFDPGRPAAATGGVFTNDINRMSSEFRDLHMYRVLTNAVVEGNRVFAVVGRNHVPMQAPALRCALN